MKRLGVSALIAIGCTTLIFLISVWQGTRDHFTLAFTLPGGDGVFGIAAGDFDGDSRTDLAVLSTETQSLSLFMGTQAGDYSSPLTDPLFKDCYFSFVAAGRFDSEAKDEIVLSGVCGLRLLKWTNGKLVVMGSYATDAYLGQIVVTDVNHDGMSDLIVADRGQLTRDSARRGQNSGFFALLGSADGQLHLRGRKTLGRGVDYLASGDFNGDGNTDVAVPNGDMDGISVCLGRGDGSFEEPRAAMLNLGSIFSISCADIDGDGRDDIAFVVKDRHQVAYSMSERDGSFKSYSWLDSEDAQAGLVLVSRIQFPGGRRAGLAVVTEHQFKGVPPRVRGALTTFYRGRFGNIQRGETIPLDYVPWALQYGGLTRRDERILLVGSWDKVHVFVGR